MQKDNKNSGEVLDVIKDYFISKKNKEISYKKSYKNIEKLKKNNKRKSKTR